MLGAIPSKLTESNLNADSDPVQFRFKHLDAIVDLSNVSIPHNVIGNGAEHQTSWLGFSLALLVDGTARQGLRTGIDNYCCALSLVGLGSTFKDKEAMDSV